MIRCMENYWSLLITFVKLKQNYQLLIKLFVFVPSLVIYTYSVHSSYLIAIMMVLLHINGKMIGRELHIKRKAKYLLHLFVVYFGLEMIFFYVYISIQTKVEIWLSRNLYKGWNILSVDGATFLSKFCTFNNQHSWWY